MLRASSFCLRNVTPKVAVTSAVATATVTVGSCTTSSTYSFFSPSSSTPSSSSVLTSSSSSASSPACFQQRRNFNLQAAAADFAKDKISEQRSSGKLRIGASSEGARKRGSTGFLMLGAGLIFINLNERRNDKQLELDEFAERMCISVTDPIDMQTNPLKQELNRTSLLEGHIFHSVGILESREESVDPVFHVVVEPKEGLKLRRVVEMFQNKETENQEKREGKDHKYYTYDKVWARAHLETKGDRKNPKFPEDLDNEKHPVKNSQKLVLMVEPAKENSSGWFGGSSSSSSSSSEQKKFLPLQLSQNFVQRVDEFVNMKKIKTSDNFEEVKKRGFEVLSSGDVFYKSVLTPEQKKKKQEERKKQEAEGPGNNNNKDGGVSDFFGIALPKELEKAAEDHYGNAAGGGIELPEVGDIRVRYEYVPAGKMYTSLGVYLPPQDRSDGIPDGGISPVRGNLQQKLSESYGELVVPEAANELANQYNAARGGSQGGLQLPEALVDECEKIILGVAPIEFAFLAQENVSKARAFKQNRKKQQQMTKGMLALGTALTCAGCGLLSSVATASGGFIYAATSVGGPIAFVTLDGARAQVIEKHKRETKKNLTMTSSGKVNM